MSNKDNNAVEAAKQKARDALYHLYGWQIDKDAFEFVFNAGLQASQQWVDGSVLPKEAGWYLVAWQDCINYNESDPSIEFFTECIQEWDMNTNTRKVLAWMPIPPYTPTGENHK